MGRKKGHTSAVDPITKTRDQAKPTYPFRILMQWADHQDHEEGLDTLVGEVAAQIRRRASFFVFLYRAQATPTSSTEGVMPYLFDEEIVEGEQAKGGQPVAHSSTMNVTYTKKGSVGSTGTTLHITTKVAPHAALSYMNML
jgi:hypothetical protein